MVYMINKIKPEKKKSLYNTYKTANNVWSLAGGSTPNVSYESEAVKSSTEVYIFGKYFNRKQKIL